MNRHIVAGGLLDSEALTDARILVIDDDDANLVLLERILRTSGFQNTLSISDSRDALSTITTYQPDMVLLDVRMPHQGGLGILETLRNREAPDEFLPVLMMTAHESKDLKRAALSLGANDFLQRPLDAAEVILRITNLLRTRSLQQQLRTHNIILTQQVRKQTESLRAQKAEAQLLATHYAQLADLSIRLGLLTDPLEVAREGIETLMQLWNFDLGSLYRVMNDRLTPAIIVGDVPAAAHKTVRAHPFVPDKGLMKHVLEQGAPYVIENFSTWEETPEEYRDMGVATVIADAIRVSGRLFGVIYITKFGTPTRMEQDSIAILTAIKLRIEQALERIELLNHLRGAREQALRVVGLSLEYRDYETKGHTDRVTRLAQRFGRALRLEQNDIEHLTWGSYLHDIGKIVIPDQILLKPARLDPAEFELIKNHTVFGEELLRNLEFLPGRVLDLVRHHHERWDGTGYPDGLVGEGIPLLARLFSIVDVFDALTSERPYKSAWSNDDARREIARQRSRQFDPDLTDIFLSLDPDDQQGIE